MTIKAKIKTDVIEIEYEGTPEFFKGEFMEIIQALPTNIVSGLDTRFVDKQPPVIAGTNGPTRTSGNAGGTTRSIAARLSAKTAPDLLLAAAARLHIMEGRDSFRRQDLLEEIKTATGYYNVNMAKNLSQNLKNLFKDGKFIELASEVYTLSAESRAELEQRLA